MSYVHRLVGVGKSVLWGGLVAGAFAGCSGDTGDGGSSPTVGESTEQLSLPTLCEGGTGLVCGADSVCVALLSLSCPGADHLGICWPRPAFCSTLAAPVCGCDGKTYRNGCLALSAGTAVASRGECKPPPCGPCAGAATCAPGASACSCGVVQVCPSAQHWSSAVDVCACVPDDPCANVACRAGEVCEAQADGTAACVVDPCYSIVCKEGAVCEAQADGSAACVADPCYSIVCKLGQVCQAQADGSAACVTDPCYSVVCKAGQTCVAQADGTAACL